MRQVGESTIIKKIVGISIISSSTQTFSVKCTLLTEDATWNAYIEECKVVAEKLKNTEVVIQVKTGEQDKVFGTVSSKQICEELKNKGFNIDKKKICLDYAIDCLGTHNVKIELHKKVIAEVKVTLKK